jgi:hypothetical protein
MNSGLVLQGHDAKYTSFQFFDCRPESVAIVFLWLSFYRILDGSNTPLLFDVRPFTQDLVLKIVSEPVFLHETNCFPVTAFIIFRLTVK